MKNVLAIVAHPDDIEFIMAGTLILLAERGWNTHYFDIANGCYGSMTMDRTETAKTRLHEAQAAAKLLGATFYPPICDDLDIQYNHENLSKVIAVVRQSNPTIVLTHSPVDYMEDHEIAGRLAVTAAFSKNMPNFRSTPDVPACSGPVAVYHAQPHGNQTPLGEPVVPQLFIDLVPVMAKKRAMLECHQSQQPWLDSTQAMSSYVDTMIELGRQVGAMSRRFALAEGWRLRSPLGFGPPDFDPLGHALSDVSCRR
jgi:N-acetylglucosamine malate deacetylase 1